MSPSAIGNVIDWNPWWGYDPFGDFDEHLSEFHKWPIRFKRRELTLWPGNIYLLRGSRQVRKTTLIKELIFDLIQENANPESILCSPCDYLHSRRELRNVIDHHVERNRAGCGGMR